jgi:hypothetical protein
MREVATQPLVDENSSSYTASWMLWANSSEHALPLPRSIDHALCDYVFYPEAEWARFGYRPPENVPLLGAWRDPGGRVFAFLLDAAAPRDVALVERRLLLSVSGIRSAVDEVGAKVTSLKSLLAKSERRELQVLHAEYRIEQEKKSPAVARLLKLIGLFTVVVNAFSLYLRQLPPPDLPAPWVQDAYQFLVVVVHFAALLLLLVITLIGIGYVLRYGILMLRRF